MSIQSLIFPLLLLVLALPLFLGARKQKRAMNNMQQLQSSLAPGDRVMTTSGLHATVVDVTSEATIDLELAEGVVTTWVRAAVREKIQPAVVEEEVAADEVAVEEVAAAKAVEVAAPATPVSDAHVSEPVEHGANGRS